MYCIQVQFAGNLLNPPPSCIVHCTHCHGQIMHTHVQVHWGACPHALHYHGALHYLAAAKQCMVPHMRPKPNPCAPLSQFSSGTHTSFDAHGDWWGISSAPPPGAQLKTDPSSTRIPLLS